jgi:6,7-dimethyl-8-ribityllumazine synthase
MNRPKKSTAGRFAIVAARFNRKIVDGLLQGAIQALRENGVPEKSIDVVRVPGSLELPLAAQRLGASKKYSAVICLGAVIKGDTHHYEYVCSGTTIGVVQAGLATGVPTIFGVLTCLKTKQARKRSGGKANNKGCEAALAAIEMANVMRQIASTPRKQA